MRFVTINTDIMLKSVLLLLLVLSPLYMYTRGILALLLNYSYDDITLLYIYMTQSPVLDIFL